MDDEINAVVARRTDDKGRVEIDELSDREIAVEILTRMRLVSDLLEAIGENPMLSRMIPGLPATNGKKGN